MNLLLSAQDKGNIKRGKMEQLNESTASQNKGQGAQVCLKENVQL